MIPHIPLFLTAATILLVVGVGFQGFQAVASRPTPTILDATISPDGSSCSIKLYNPASAQTHVTEFTLSSAFGSPAVSFASSFALHPNQTETYLCPMGTSAQFVPTLNGVSGAPYNLTARFDDGTVASYASAFS